MRIKKKKVAPILFDSISKSEYLGYDSIGIATACEDKINLKKDAGKIAEVDSKLNLKDFEGNYGIAHVRWTTHGDPSKTNSHLHLNKDQTIEIIHNGIIENYLSIKEELESEGYGVHAEAYAGGKLKYGSIDLIDDNVPVVVVAPPRAGP